MLSLFSSNKSSDRPKPKPKQEPFDLDSFLTNVGPTTKDITVDAPRPKPTPTPNPEDERIVHVPSKSALKIMDEVHRKPESVSKDIEKVSKKLSKSLKQLDDDHQRAQNMHKATQNKIKRTMEEAQKNALKHRSEIQYPKKSEFASSDRHGNYSHGDSSANFSRIPQRKESSPPTAKSLPKKSYPKPNPTYDDNERLEIPEDVDLLHLQKNESYDPLDFMFAPPTMKHESSELYDPLNVSIRKTSEEQKPPRPAAAKLEHPGHPGLIGKRSSAGGSDGYEPDISKKIKNDDQRKRLDAIFKGGKNAAPKPQSHQSHQSGYNNNGQKARKSTHDSDEDRGGYGYGGYDQQEDPDDEARRELEKMFGGYRKKVQGRKQYEDDVDDMEAGFDDIEREDRISRHIGHKEDKEQLRYIQMEEMNERRGKVQ